MRAIRVLGVVLVMVGLAAPCPGSDATPAAEAPVAKAPLVIASDSGPRIEFQVGADLFGGGLSGVDFIGGVNATFVYPVLDLLWVGIRPALHYVFMDDSDYRETWMHADAVLQLNLLHEPVRLYFLLAGGYAFALDSNIPDLSHGFSALGGLGVAWRPAESRLGMFCELGFRYGSASVDATRLALDERGRPVYDEAATAWVVEDFEQHFELMALTVNLGLTYSP